MTSDAKVGLLLGLVFIFIIAFLINGLPSFRADKNNNELMKNYMLNPPDRVIGIGGGEVKIKGINQSSHTPALSPGQPPVADGQNRFETPLPGVSPDVNQADAAAKTPGQANPPAVPGPVNPQVAKANEEPKQAAGAAEYVVKAGDTMSGIAKKFYGAAEGNKLANIERIFKANEKVVKSVDMVYEGQKLVIPPLAEKAVVRKSPADVLKGPMFEKADSVAPPGKGTSGAPEHVKLVVPPKAPKREAVSDKARYYMVKDGDNLWRIAVQQLGDGNRYKEIVKLNGVVLKDENAVAAGTKLKLPSR